MSTGTPTTVLIEASIVPSVMQSVITVAGGALDKQAYVRRPMRGIQLKKETYASLSVSASSLALKNSSAPKDVGVNFTSNFLLQSINSSRQEKFQPIPTFGAPYGYFFGEQHRMVACRAVLLNSADFQWEAEWWENYDQYLRGTRLVDRGVQAVLEYEDVVLYGYIVNADVTVNEPTPWYADLSFTMWVVRAERKISVGAVTIDPFHLEAGATEWDEFDSNEAVSPTMLEEVRARNVAAISTQETGLVGALQSALSSLQGFTDKVGNVINNVTDWLYGRNMVIPAGFAGSEVSAGSSVFAEKTSVTIKTPVTVVVSRKGSFFEDNVDEYPQRWGATTHLLGSNVIDTTYKDPATAYAESMYRSFGIDVTNDEGSGGSDLMRTLGKVTFAAVSYVGSGATTQDAKGLAATVGSANYIAAIEEQALVEALR